ncbi:hypothetical protein K6U06_18670 [Acidiferrimicrobium sp. IK]|uniref:hypothetical protein n=1 Tax=Acidiferrimicrobium sp. IK TaxID=2871700 RepID=UPI0021CB572B|nr:hypothetical protein [Acidiferrimicrobium sp. IK]MCU4186398.1 hypothetical protein [Acidiferrimicrobium sp. IK]
MAVVRFYTADQGDLPSVCAKTGRPTGDRVEVDAYFRPLWPWLLLPFSWLATLVGILAGVKAIKVTLPVSADVADRYRRWRAVPYAIAGAGVAVLVVGAVLRSAPVLAAGVLTEAGAALARAVNLLAHTCAVSANAEGDVITLGRCHRKFKAALRELANG